MPSNLEVLKALLPYEQLQSSFVELFVNEYGLSKACDIDKDVEQSGKATRFLADSLYHRKRYDHKSFIMVIQTGRNFWFKKAEIVCFASLLLLENWRTEVGNVSGLSDEGYLKKMFFDIIAECDRYKTHVSGKPNLFERYNKILLNIQDSLTTLIAKGADIKQERENSDEFSEDELESGTTEEEWNIDRATSHSAADELPF